MGESSGKWEAIMDAYRTHGHEWMTYKQVHIDGKWVWRIADYKTGMELAIADTLDEAQAVMDEIRSARQEAREVSQ